MTRKITTYEDLLEEEQRLQQLLDAQKKLVQSDIEEIKLELAPAIQAVSFAGRLITRDGSNPLVNMGVNSVIDVVIKKGLLGKSGWLARLAVPFFLKNFSSHVVNDNLDKIKGGFQAVKNWFSKNGKQHDDGHNPVDADDYEDDDE